MRATPRTGDSAAGTVATGTDKTAAARPAPRPVKALLERLPDSEATNAQVTGLPGGFDYVTPGLNPSPNFV
jgi:hypothetical protein